MTPVATPSPVPLFAVDPESGCKQTPGTAWLATFVLAVFLVVNLPIFLCMPLDCDIVIYDLCARNVLAGGVHYVDTFDTNLPGMVWAHVAVRWLFGWRSEAIRLVDFGVVSGIVCLLIAWLPGQVRLPVKMGLALILYTFYFSLSEWCHCQRDVWMLLPSLAALSLRRARVRRLQEASPVQNRWSFVEGLLWGAAFWIKPHVAVPALACWLAASRLVWHEQGRRRLAADAASVWAGGITAGAVGVCWLLRTGAWPAFLEIMFEWNWEYARYDMKQELGWTYVAGGLVRFFPWCLAHLIAVPVALQRLLRGPTQAPCGQPRDAEGSTVLQAAFYLGWLFQAVCLQHPFDNIQAPALFLALTLVYGRCVGSPLPVVRGALISFFALCLLLRYPSLMVPRLACWPDCVQQGSTAELRDRLSLLHRIDWQELRQVRDYLSEQQAHDGQVTCFSATTLPLYLELGIRPSTRHLLLQGTYSVFASKRGRLQQELDAGAQRYVACDLSLRNGDRHSVLAAVGDRGLKPEAAPRNFRELFPRPMTLVFRAGDYAVFALDEPRQTAQP